MGRQNSRINRSQVGDSKTVKSLISQDFSVILIEGRGGGGDDENGSTRWTGNGGFRRRHYPIEQAGDQSLPQCCIFCPLFEKF